MSIWTADINFKKLKLESVYEILSAAGIFCRLQVAG